MTSNAIKHCSQCRRDLPESEFYVNRSRSNSLSRYCKECTRSDNKKRYHDVLKHDEAYKTRVQDYSQGWHKEFKKRRNEATRLNHRRQREEVIEAYGGRCECCGEARFEFLALDHAFGDGKRHRKEVGTKIARWLKKENYPKDLGIRVLCHNCNASLGYYGYCPHRSGA